VPASVALVVSAGLVAARRTAASALVSRATVISRAQKWVNDGVTYSQSRTHLGYRTTARAACPTPGCWPSRASTPPVPEHLHQDRQGFLKRGDILLNKAAGNSGHVAIFEKWANSAHSSYVGTNVRLRHPPPHDHVPVLLGYGTFGPYRYNSITAADSSESFQAPPTWLTPPTGRPP